MTHVLRALRRQFPRYRIWHEVHGEHTRLVARSVRLGINPYAVVTADPAELRRALSGAQ